MRDGNRRAPLYRRGRLASGSPAPRRPGGGPAGPDPGARLRPEPSPHDESPRLHPFARHRGPRAPSRGPATRTSGDPRSDLGLRLRRHEPSHAVHRPIVRTAAPRAIRPDPPRAGRGTRTLGLLPACCALRRAHRRCGGRAVFDSRNAQGGARAFPAAGDPTGSRTALRGLHRRDVGRAPGLAAHGCAKVSMAHGLALHLALLLVVPPLLLGVIQKTKAWFAGRSGAPLLQPYFDLLSCSRRAPSTAGPRPGSSKRGPWSPWRPRSVLDSSCPSA